MGKKKKQRIKSTDDLIPIADWPTADRLVRQIGLLQNDIAKEELLCAERIDAAKRDLQTATLPKHASLDRLVKSLEAFCRAERDAFGGQQSRRLQFGAVGFRRSAAIRIKKTTLDLVKSVFGRTAAKYLHIKEQVNKEALAKLPTDQLDQLDARRETKETFYVEPDKIESVDV